MGKIGKFLSVFSPLRKVVVVIFAVLLSVSSASMLAVIVLSLFFEPRSIMNEETLTVTMATIIAAWFVSAMVFSSTSNHSLQEDRDRRKQEKEDWRVEAYEERLALDALKSDLEQIRKDDPLFTDASKAGQ